MYFLLRLMFCDKFMYVHDNNLYNKCIDICYKRLFTNRKIKIFWFIILFVALRKKHASHGQMFLHTSGIRLTMHDAIDTRIESRLYSYF